jgi:hypothetical protein
MHNISHLIHIDEKNIENNEWFVYTIYKWYDIMSLSNII